MTQIVSLPYESNAVALHVNNWVSPLGCNTTSPTKWTKYLIKGISMLIVYIINCFDWMPLLTDISYKTTLIWDGNIGTKLHKLGTECHIAAISIDVSSNSRIFYVSLIRKKLFMHTYLYRWQVVHVGHKAVKQSHCCLQKYFLTLSNKLQQRLLIVHKAQVEANRYFFEFNLDVHIILNNKGCGLKTRPP